MKVRALPTWRNPVGEGAKRTRGVPLEFDWDGFDISDWTLDGTGGVSRRQALYLIVFLCNCMIQKEIKGTHCT